MAEAVEISENKSSHNKEKGENMECAVCLQKCIHPAKLPCGHIFCFLCVKGFANQNKKCAMCRQEIPRDFIEQPNLLEPVLLDKTVTFDDGFQWFYEGRNGWWQYDERTSKDLENSYKNNEKTCELLIAGFLYIVDLENMLQIRRNDPSRRRRIKRDFASVPKKGVAGLHGNKQTNYDENPNEFHEVNTNEIDINLNEQEVQISGEVELEVTLDMLNDLHLNDNQ
ncbi:E3 ubiquitin-protein ligase rnf146-like [Diorhabda sublineata]|uniref:E3 ubiquitin-protein ligase rnf146-like n=1 Tax=Diorhabda sublineata TaxID=1163346 RepID=UPI0024E05951|nr:E3 ubiquitin-protein ligase rnf146-like [Diorhabda sublineata]